MKDQKLIESFSEVAANAGAVIVPVESIEAAAEFINSKVEGRLLLPSFASRERFDVGSALAAAGVDVVTENFRGEGEQAEAGVTGVNFAIADTGTLVLDSTEEDIRLATTLPVKHFALLDPRKIVADGLEAVGPMRQLHEKGPRNFVAYITGPSRTADIERVLTIGVHGPKQLFILLVPGLSDNLQEM
jgi:L-lactate dehydrogenase complex protein LldG